MGQHARNSGSTCPEYLELVAQFNPELVAQFAPEYPDRGNVDGYVGGIGCRYKVFELGRYFFKNGVGVFKYNPFVSGNTQGLVDELLQVLGVFHLIVHLFVPAVGDVFVKGFFDELSMIFVVNEEQLYMVLCESP